MMNGSRVIERSRRQLLRTNRLIPQSFSTTTSTTSSSPAANANTSNASNASSNPPSSYLQGSTTHFGYESVPIAEKQSRVRSVFENVAESYDVMNDFMSFGLHRWWKDELLRMSGVKPMARILRANAFGRQSTVTDDVNADTDTDESGSLLRILDVAGGTGDVAFRFLQAAECIERTNSSGKDEISITVCDINADMLRVGERRARSMFGNSILDDTNALSFIQGNAQDLNEIQDGQYDLYTIAFGLRNVTNVDLALEEAYRVLKPGGRFLCLEFSHVPNDFPLLASIYNAYSFHVIPQLGHIVANDYDSYQYLVESIRQFCTQDELKDRLELVGFQGCSYTNMTGGIVAVHEGWKPMD